MLIDCDGCQVRGAACRDCVVTVLLGLPGEFGSEAGLPGPVEFDEVEQAAMSVLAAGGLIPPLRLVPIVSGHEPPTTASAEQTG